MLPCKTYSKRPRLFKMFSMLLLRLANVRSLAAPSAIPSIERALLLALTYEINLSITYRSNYYITLLGLSRLLFNMFLMRDISPIFGEVL